jgi:hypothetical protein
MASQRVRGLCGPGRPLNETTSTTTPKGRHSRLPLAPLTLYPSGRCEVVFQHLARRPPFDDIRLREELRQRLNTVAGIDLAAAKIELRLSFPLSVLSEPSGASTLIESLEWFQAAL